MTVVYRNDRLKDTEIKEKTWVRIKSGLYHGDLAFVELVDEEKVFVRLIPRIENANNKELE